MVRGPDDWKGDFVGPVILSVEGLRFDLQKSWILIIFGLRVVANELNTENQILYLNVVTGIPFTYTRWHRSANAFLVDPQCG